jgi:sugar/nucleoside kinase (ribokinase family)
MIKFDLIAVGDNATDAFIRLSEAELNCQIDKPECKICMKFASKIPYESVTEVPAGGNSSNVAIGSAKLGLQVAFISNIGNDNNGAKTLDKLAKANIDTTWVKQNAGIPTNYNYVLWYADDRTILVKHEDHPSFWPFDPAQDKPFDVSQDKPEDLPVPTWLYLSSVKDDDFSYHAQIANWLTAHPETKLAFSPGTWQIKAGVEKLKAIYAHTAILFCNKQEAEKIAMIPDDGLLGAVQRPSSGTLRTLAESIKELGPKTVVITDSENGASVLDANNNFYQIPASYIFGKAIERTGAGDAFASAYLGATIAGLSTEKALAWGATNASSVVTKIGPHEGLLTRAQIEEKLS